MALLAHQIKTPLATINALAQGLLRRSNRMSEEDIRDRAEKIRQASLIVGDMIDRILCYTRANTGEMSLNLTRFAPGPLIRRVCQEQGGQEPEHRIELDIQPLPARLTGDPVLLEQVLVIVLSNAMKYSPPDRPIRVCAHVSDGKVAIVVQDQGIGVPEGDLPFLMQPFFRGRNAKEKPGTGLGLSLAWHILKLHNGSIQLQSREGQGMTATIMLPIGAAPAPRF